MSSTNCLRDVFYRLVMHKSIQENIGGTLFFIELSPCHNKIVILSPIYSGVGLIPQSIRSYLEGHNARYQIDDLDIAIGLDEKTSEILASCFFGFNDMGPDAFAKSMKKFISIAKIWQMKLSEYEQKDLVYVKGN